MKKSPPSDSDTATALGFYFSHDDQTCIQEEFVAHESSVNCLKIGRKTSRVLVTGGEDHKVNLWAIGKPNAILSLSGHTSGIDSVSLDSGEVLVAAGAANGTIKLWDLEEGKIVRTLTGHRSNCISVDFHPFGEFFASGSLDTNLKIWDIRKKGCIHTYKGHTRGVSAIRFTPDGRWVVSGGEDNTVKLWDLTAGKLMHDFKSHEGQIQCIDFHPHEFLLATGSADRTVKFWDLETFEMIGSSSPEASGVRCITFNPDGRTLLCGLHESLKVLSWEPIRCHDGVDVGWSRLLDLNIHEGKLLGCSYNQSCVGVWVVDISRIETSSNGSATRLDDHKESKANLGENLPALNENTSKISFGRRSVSGNLDPIVKETKPVERISVMQKSELAVEEINYFASTRGLPGTPQRVNFNTDLKTTLASSMTIPNATSLKRMNPRTQCSTYAPILNKSDVVPVIVPRTNASYEQEAESRKEVSVIGKTMPFSLLSKRTEFQKFQNREYEYNRSEASVFPETMASRAREISGVAVKNFSHSARTSSAGSFSPERNVTDERFIGSGKHVMNSTTDTPFYQQQHGSYEMRVNKVSLDDCSSENKRRGSTRQIVSNWEKRERSPAFEDCTSSNTPATATEVNMPQSHARGSTPSAEKERRPATDEDAIAYMMEQHDQFVTLMLSRYSKLQVIRRYWERNDVKRAISAMEKMADHAAAADIISILTEKPDIITLDICTCLMPLLNDLLQSDMDRHLGITLEMLLKLVRVFGSVIYSTVSASSSVGVDIEAEQRLERCNLCFIELEKVKRCLPALTRKGGSVTKSAQELNMALQEVF